MGLAWGECWWRMSMLRSSGHQSLLVVPRPLVCTLPTAGAWPFCCMMAIRSLSVVLGFARRRARAPGWLCASVTNAAELEKHLVHPGEPARAPDRLQGFGRQLQRGHIHDAPAAAAAEVAVILEVGVVERGAVGLRVLPDQPLRGQGSQGPVHGPKADPGDFPAHLFVHPAGVGMVGRPPDRSQHRRLLLGVPEFGHCSRQGVSVLLRPPPLVVMSTAYYEGNPARFLPARAINSPETPVRQPRGNPPEHALR